MLLSQLNFNTKQNRKKRNPGWILNLVSLHCPSFMYHINVRVGRALTVWNYWDVCGWTCLSLCECKDLIRFTRISMAAQTQFKAKMGAEATLPNEAQTQPNVERWRSCTGFVYSALLAAANVWASGWLKKMATCTSVAHNIHLYATEI